jgi:hypothetical protein
MVKEIPKFSKYYKYFLTSSTQMGSLSSNLTFFWIPPGHHDWLTQALTPSKARVTEVHNFKKKKGGDLTKV